MSGRKDKRKQDDADERADKKVKPLSEQENLFNNVAEFAGTAIGGGCASSSSSSSQSPADIIKNMNDELKRISEQINSQITTDSGDLKTLDELLELDTKLPPLQLESANNNTSSNLYTSIVVYLAYCAGIISAQPGTQAFTDALNKMANEQATRIIANTTSTLSTMLSTTLTTMIKTIVPLISGIAASYVKQGGNALIEVGSGNIAPLTLFIIETYLAVRFVGLDVHIVSFAKKVSTKIAERAELRLSEIMNELHGETRIMCNVVTRAPQQVFNTIIARAGEGARNLIYIFGTLGKEAFNIAHNLTNIYDIDELSVSSDASTATIQSAVIMEDTLQELLTVVTETNEPQIETKLEEIVEHLQDTETTSTTELVGMEVDNGSNENVSPYGTQEDLSQPFETEEEDNSSLPLRPSSPFASQSLPITPPPTPENSQSAGNKKYKNKTNKHKKSKKVKFKKHIKRTKHKRNHNKLRKTLKRKH